jgi:5'-3' exoribonuclease 2
MGVPAFFRWLSEKYPRIIEDIVEDRVKLLGGQGSARVPFDSTRPNPSGLECDNLYVDLNGIIHPCSHPEQGPQPKTEEEMYENVCHYVDRLFRMMRPRKLLYLAIDGVAPRAKMNQQRARRFRSAQEARENLETEQNVRNELSKMGQKVPPAKKAWDSNVITPGTPFMLRLADYLRFYIRKRISTDKAWQNIRVIFSDASVPGEGEHKIMSHVRLQRSQPGYSPNLVHVLHGLDADLIMLALATHEAHFYISREEVLFGRKSQEENEKRQIETMFRDKQRALDEEAGESAMQLLENKQKPIVRVSIPILREYLANEFAACLTPGRILFPPSLERLIDDIVFLCFFVGNDFLPHLPSLDIRVGALDYLFNVYKRILPTLGDYITSHGGQVNLSHVDVILAEVGSIEDHVFSMKHENEMREQERREQMKARKKSANGRSIDAPPPVAPTNTTPRGRAAKILARQVEQKQALMKKEGKDKIKVSHMQTKANLDAAEALKKSLLGGLSGVKKEEDNEGVIKKEDMETSDPSVVKKEENDGANSDVKQENAEAAISEEICENAVKTEDGIPKDGRTKRKLDQVKAENGVGEVGDVEDEFDADDDDDDEEEEPAVVIEEDLSPEVAKAFKDRVKTQQQKKLDEYSKNVEDKVRLHEQGWKDRYYSDKCKADDVAAHGGREHLFRSYVMGLCWVMKYYYDGCPSWKWFYPFHYGPFASDLRNIERFQNDVKSFDTSRPFNPVEQLMAVLPSDSSPAIPKEARWLMEDPESPIIDFYPKDVPVDPNGKAMPWLWVVLLPFIDEERLLSAL